MTVPNPCKLQHFLHFSRMRSKGSRFTLGVWGLRVCSLDVAFVVATVRNRSQPFATVRTIPVWPCLWEVLQRLSFLGFSDVSLLRFAWQAWHCDIQTCSATCWKSFRVAGAILLWRFQKMCCSFRGRRSTLDVSIVFFRGRRSTLDVSCCVFFCKSHSLAGLRQVATRCKFRGRRGIFWHVLKIDGSLARNIDFEVANFQVLRKTRFCSCKVSKLEEVSYEMLVLVLPRVSSRVSGFPVASPCLSGSCKTCPFVMLPTVKIAGSLVPNDRFGAPTCLVSSLWFSCGFAVSMGEAGKHVLFECFQAGCHVVLRGRRGTLWHFNLFDNVWKISKLEEVSHEMLVFFAPRVSSRVAAFPLASPCLWGKLENMSFSNVSKQVVMSFCVAGVALCDISTCLITCGKISKLEEVLHEMLVLRDTHVSRLESLVFLWLRRVYGGSSALHTLHFTLHNLRFRPHTLHFTLHTLHFALYTPHSSPETLHSTLHTLHYTLHFPLLTPHSTLYTPHSTLYTPHSTLYTTHSLLYTPHFPLHTPHSTLHTLHSSLHTLHSSLYTLHSSLYTLHSTLYTLHSTLYTLQSTLYTLHSTLHTVHFTLHTLHTTLYTFHSTFRTPHFTLHTLHFTLLTPHSTLHTPHFTHHTPHSTLSTPHSALHTPHFTVHSTLHTLYFTLLTPHFALLTLHSTLHTLHTTLYTFHSRLHTLHFTLHTPHFTLHTFHSTLHTPHSTLYTPHSSLHTLHSSLYTLHSSLHTLHSTLHTLHSTLHTPHFPLHTPHSTLHTPHFTLLTPHFTLHTPHFTLHTLHSTLYSPHFTLYTPRFPLYTPHSTLYTPHCTLQTPHSTLYTPYSTLYTLYSAFYTLHTLHSPLHTLHSTLYTPHSLLHFTLHTPHSTLSTPHCRLVTRELSKYKLLQKDIVRYCITMCFDICTINIRVSIRVRGLHLVWTIFLPWWMQKTMMFTRFSKIEDRDVSETR